MARNVKENPLFEESVDKETGELERLVAPQATPYKKKYIYANIVTFLYIYTAGVYGIKYIIAAKWSTLIFMYIYFIAGVLGMTAGVHRLWSHKSYKAKLPLQIFLMLCHSSVNQFSVIWWVQIHRQHHKYSDTDGDPMNAARGLFFSHMGWLLVNKHPECVKRRKYVDASDVRNDPLLKIQKKYGLWIISTMTLLLPSLLPLVWGESFTNSWYLNMLRLFVSYNILFTVNSIGHTYGNKPFDQSLRATQTGLLHFVAFGDGYHNYHHSFPWDYRSDEWGGQWNFTTMFIDACARIGLVYDRKIVPQDVVNARAVRTGDGSKITH